MATKEELLALAEKQLRYALVKDAEKGWSGVRETVEVADYLSVSTARARDILNTLERTGLVERLDGRPILWRAVAQEPPR